MVVTNVCLSMWGCGLVMRTPAAWARWRRRRVAAWRSIRGAAAVEQDRPAYAVAVRPVDGPADRWRQRNQHDLAAQAQHPVAVLLAQVGDVGSGGFKDPHARQAQHGHQRKIVPAG